jgi:hypothetical protein
MSNNFETNKLEGIRKFYQEAFSFFDRKRPVPEIDVRFYPYIGINHTIRIRERVVYVRICEICRDMPDLGQKALAYILVAKLLRKPVPVKAREIYSKFIKTAEVREKAVENKRARGRKVVGTARGAVYDLSEIFDRVNSTYFQNAVAKPVLTWSARRTYRILGHHDSTHETIAVSRSLDDRHVPEYVVEYVVFHEMLHIWHPTQHRNGRRYNHTPAFRRDEEKFLYFNQAEDWIEKNVRVLKRKAKSGR